jgi:hypothetical protein
MRLYIFFEDNHAELGILAHDEFITAIKPESEESVDSSMIVTTELISKIKLMPTMEFGFTDNYKIQFIELFTQNLNKKLVLATEFFIRPSLAKKYKEVVASMNLHDLTYQQAATVVNNKYATETATSDV